MFRLCSPVARPPRVLGPAQPLSLLVIRLGLEAAATPDIAHRPALGALFRKPMRALLRLGQQETATAVPRVVIATALARDPGRGRAVRATHPGRAALADRGADRLIGADLVVLLLVGDGPGEVELLRLQESTRLRR